MNFGFEILKTDLPVLKTVDMFGSKINQIKGYATEWARLQQQLRSHRQISLSTTILKDKGYNIL